MVLGSGWVWASAFPPLGTTANNVWASCNIIFPLRFQISTSYSGERDGGGGQLTERNFCLASLCSLCINKINDALLVIS